MKCPCKCLLFVLGLLVTPAGPETLLVGPRVIAAEQGPLSVAAYPSIQAAVDANPGQVLWVPAGDYVLSEAVQLRQAGSGLWGPGRLLQSSPTASVIEVQGAYDVRLRDLTLTRSADQASVSASAIVATRCKHLSLENVSVLNNRSAAAAIRIQECQHASVVRCVVRNYMTISVDDRTASPHFGYAFHCIDGTGIVVTSCQDVLLQANRILEEDVRPTREMKERHQLGQFSKRAPSKGWLVNQATWDAGYVNNWHQGSAIVVTDPKTTSFVRLLDNHIENSAQGIDIHADFVTCSGNFIVNAFMGMKAMHGSRHVLITNNQFIRNDLWAIGLMPGTASGGLPAESETPARAANADGGSVIANNIISDFGQGDSHWIWDPQQNTCAPLVFDHGQEADDPPLSHVLVTGNIVCESGQGFASNDANAEPPRYRFAVYISDAAHGPRELHFGDNLFQAGTEGISNRELIR